MEKEKKQFNEIKLGDVCFYLVRRKKLNEYLIFEEIHNYKPIFRTDMTIHIGQIIIQYDENNNLINNDSIDIISEIQWVDGSPVEDQYIFYIMDINDWIDSRLEELINAILKYGIDLYIEELEKLRNLKKQIDFTSIKEVKEIFINDYFEKSILEK